MENLQTLGMKFPLNAEVAVNLRPIGQLKRLNHLRIYNRSERLTSEILMQLLCDCPPISSLFLHGICGDEKILTTIADCTGKSLQKLM